MIPLALLLGATLLAVGYRLGERRTERQLPDILTIPIVLDQQGLRIIGSPP